MNVSRLFDFLTYQNKNYPKADAFAAKEKGTWKQYSTQDAIQKANKVSLSLLKLGIQPDDKIAIVSNNRPEWMFVDLGILQIGAVNVPLYPTISPDEYKYILNHAEIKYAFVSDKELFDKVNTAKAEVPSLKEIYTFDDVPGAKHWSEFLKEGEGGDIAKVEELKAKVKEEDLATIIYTSGTTGVPKGVMLSHHNIASNVKTCLPLLPIGSESRALSFLPLNHVFERMLTYLYLYAGVSVYYAESMETIGDNLKEVHPHFFTAVPRLLEKVYDKIVAKGADLTGIKKSLFFWALELGLKYEIGKDMGFWYNFQLKLANKLIFSKWREALGGNIVAISTGSAPLQPRLAKVFTAAGITVLEGYGLTETSPVVATNLMDINSRRVGTVGPVIEGVEVEIAEDGEILIKGPNVMMGYYKNEEATKEAIDHENWFHTGDIGCFEDGRFLKITDRKKEIFKTSGGKYVAPQTIENKLKESSLIEQIMVVGEYQKFVGALIVPAFEALKKWCQENKINYTTDEEIVKNPKVIDEYERIVNAFNPNFSKVEQIKRFKLVPSEWTVETKELTPTMKPKRRVIMEKYKHLVDEIYNV